MVVCSTGARFGTNRNCSSLPHRGALSSMKRWWGRLSTDRKISFASACGAGASAIIASCALFLALYDGYQTRRHQRLLVMPRIIFDFRWSGDGAGWLIGNQGIGPADIRWFSVLVDGRPQRNWIEVVAAIGVPPGYIITNQLILAPGQLLPAHPEAGTLFWITGAAAKQVFQRQSHRVVVKACYCSLYGECWETLDDGHSIKESSCKDGPPFRFTAVR